MARNFIIRAKYGGLGDHLFLSHLPRVAKQHGGFDAVYISTRSEFRRPEYQDLVWKINPFVDGFVDEDAPYPEFLRVSPEMNLLDQMMLERGLDDGQRFHEPELYYKPTHLKHFVDKSVYDPNFVTGVGEVSPGEIQEHISSICNLDYQLKPRDRSFPVSSSAMELETQSLLDYCDIIFSCTRFFCLTSGGATLAAALRKPAVVFFGKNQPPMFQHSKLHRYIDASPGQRRMDTQPPAAKILLLNPPLPKPHKTEQPKKLTTIAIHCAWKPEAQHAYQDLGVTLSFSPSEWDNHDFAVDLDAPFSDRVATYPAERRIYATTEPSKYFNYNEEFIGRLSAHYGALILSWHPQLLKLPQCKPWHAVEKWATPVSADDPKEFGIGGLISPKNVPGFDGYALRMRIIERQDELILPGVVHNFSRVWRGNPVPYPIPSKDDSLRFMFHLAIENCAEENYFTEKLIDAFAARCVPIYYGDPSIGSVFDTRGMIMLDRDDFIRQINALTEEDYRSRLPYIQENFERSKQFWSLDDHLAQVLSREVKSPRTAPIKLPNSSKLCPPKVAGSDSGDRIMTEVNPGSDFSRVIADVFRLLVPRQIIETGTFLGTGTTVAIAQAIRDLEIRDAQFKTIECNPQHAQQARANLERAGLDAYVDIINGITLPRSQLPSLSKIDQSFTNCKFEEQIYVDYQDKDRAQMYYRETDFPNVPDDVLGRCLHACHHKPDFVLLDSAGHVGHDEFKYLLERLKGPCVIALDDVYHVKHYESLRQIQSDPRFEILALSREKFGFCVAAFSPYTLPSPDQVRRLIWIRADAVGDNVLASSMLPEIRKHYPKASITVVCDQRVAELYGECPYVDKTIDFDRDKLQADRVGQQQLADRLKSIGADLCLNSAYSLEPLSDFLVAACHTTAVGFRATHDNSIPEMIEPHNQLHNHLVFGLPAHVQELDRHRQFLRRIGIDAPAVEPLVWLSNDDESFANSFFKESGLNPFKTIALFAGAQGEKKIYFNYGKALRNVCAKHGLSVIALGARQDFDLNQQNVDDTHCRTVNLSGKTSLRQAAALIKRCRMAVGADTGLAHMACAVGARVVTLLGGAHFGRFFPYSRRSSIAALPLDCFGCGWKCKYTEAHCVTKVSIDVLSEAIQQTLETESDKPRIFITARSTWPAESEMPAWRWPATMVSKESVDVIEVVSNGSTQGMPRCETSNSPANKQDALELSARPDEIQVSICIITNAGLEQHAPRRVYLQRLLSSIKLAQFPEGAFEVIICGAIGQTLPGIKTIERTEHAKNGKVCALRNEAVRAARGKVVIHCDDDVLFTPGYWKAVGVFMQRDDWDILCTRLLNPNGTRYWDWAAHYPSKGQTLLPYDVADPFVYATGGHAVYRRAIFDKLHWPESILHGANEEFDLAAQARQHGFKFALCSQAAVFLQYHHCDAHAVVKKQPQATDIPCNEFLTAMAQADPKFRPASPTIDRTKLRARLGHKLVLPKNINSPSQANNASVDVSILVCCHRFMQRFRIFAQSFCRQHYDLNRVELIVANPHSPDGLSDYLRLLKNACDAPSGANSRGPHIREVLCDAAHFKNRGQLIQRAFEQSRGEFVIGMDADIIVPPGFLTRITTELKAKPDSIVGVYRNFLSAQTTESIIAGMIDPFVEFERLLGEDNEEPQGFRGILGYCQAVTRDHWQAVGYPVEFDNIAKSDVEFVERLRQRGVSLSFLKDVRVLHLSHPRNWEGATGFL